MWDRSYYEARKPDVPAMLLELLSHQNMADQRYGFDPGFRRIHVSRAIYKGILRYLADAGGRGMSFSHCLFLIWQLSRLRAGGSYPVAAGNRSAGVNSRPGIIQGLHAQW